MTAANYKTPGQGIAVPYMAEGSEIQIQHTNEGTDSMTSITPDLNLAELLANVRPGDGINTTIVTETVGFGEMQCDVILDRHDGREGDGTVSPTQFTLALADGYLRQIELNPRDITQLIDALNNMRETWIRLDLAAFE